MELKQRTKGETRAYFQGHGAGLKQAANWLRRNANAERTPKVRAAFIEAHNAILSLAELHQDSAEQKVPR